MADEREVVIRVKSEDEASATLKQTADNLQDVAAAQKNVEATVTAAAQAVQDQITAIRSSNGSLDEQKDALEAVRDGLVEVQHQAEATGEDGAQAFNFTVAAIERVNDELRTLKHEADNAAAAVVNVKSDDMDQFRHRIELATKAEQDLAKAFDEGSQEVGEKLGKLMGQQIKFKSEIEKTYGSIEKAPAVAREAYGKLTVSVEKATVEVRQFTHELNKQKEAAGLTQTQFNGIGDAFTKMLGPAGQSVTTLGAFASALTVGYETGHRFAESIGTDFSEMDRVTKGLAEKLKNVNSELANATVSAFTGDWKEAINALHAADASMNLTANAMSGYRAALAAGVTDIENVTEKQQELTKINEFHAAAIRNGTDGQTLWNEVVARSGGTIDGMTAAVQKLSPELDVLVRTRVSDEQASANWEARAKTVAAAIEDQSAKVRKLADEWKKQSNQIMDQVLASETQGKVTNGTTAELQHYSDVLKSLLPQAEQHYVALQQQAAAMQTALDKQDGLTAAQRGALQAQIDFTNAQVAAIETMGKHTAAASGAGAAILSSFAPVASILNSAAAAADNITSSLKGVENQSMLTAKALAEMGRAALTSTDPADKPTYIPGGDNPTVFGGFGKPGTTTPAPRPAPELGGGFGR